jgi:hypothetical protein
MPLLLHCLLVVGIRPNNKMPCAMLHSFLLDLKYTFYGMNLGNFLAFETIYNP